MKLSRLMERAYGKLPPPDKQAKSKAFTELFISRNEFKLAALREPLFCVLLIARLQGIVASEKTREFSKLVRVRKSDGETLRSLLEVWDKSYDLLSCGLRQMEAVFNKPDANHPTRIESIAEALSIELGKFALKRSAYLETLRLVAELLNAPFDFDADSLRSFSRGHVRLIGHLLEDRSSLCSWLCSVKELYRDYTKAELEVLRQHSKFIEWACKPFRRRGISRCDSSQSGAISVLSALWDFEVERGFAFTTFSYRGIRWKARLYGDKFYAASGMVAYPTPEQRLLLREYLLLCHKQRKIFDAESAAELLGVDSVLLRAICSGQDANWIDRDHVSVEIDDMDELPAADYLDEEVERIGLADRIQRVLKTLSYREREIIKLRYGLSDGYSYTLEEVGHVFRVGEERIRQIEAKAVRKLQEPSRNIELFGFLDIE